MAACPRSEIVRPGEPGIYHVWTRTVRQAFLCGVDPVSGSDYSERRTWIREFQEVIAGQFAIEIAFRCEMSNHLHLVLKVQPEVVKHWSDTEVVTRWLRLKRLVWSKDGNTQPLREGWPRMQSLADNLNPCVAVCREFSAA